MGVQLLFRPAPHDKIVLGDNLYGIFFESMTFRHKQSSCLIIKLSNTTEGKLPPIRFNGLFEDGFLCLSECCGIPLSDIKN